jgi:NAD(P)H-hydrate epimerase
MNLPALSREQSRELDRLAIEDYGIPSMVLMENAGRGTADELCRRGVEGPVVVCCGKGNNGGDGFVVARHLELRGHEVRTLLWAAADELRGDAATNFGILKKAGLPIEHFAPDDSLERLPELFDGAAWLVDALLGTGATGEPRPPFDRVIAALNEAAAPKLAVDVPSGLDCDTGTAASLATRAGVTCTFGAMKRGYLAPEAKPFTGDVCVVDIGTPSRLLAQLAGG